MSIKHLSHKAICPQCNGNGFLRKSINIISIWRWALKYSKIVQCKKCKSEGELIYDEQLATGQFNPYAIHNHTDNIH